MKAPYHLGDTVKRYYLLLATFFTLLPFSAAPQIIHTLTYKDIWTIKIHSSSGHFEVFPKEQSVFEKNCALKLPNSQEHAFEVEEEDRTLHIRQDYETLSDEYVQLHVPKGIHLDVSVPPGGKVMLKVTQPTADTYKNQPRHLRPIRPLFTQNARYTIEEGDHHHIALSPPYQQAFSTPYSWSHKKSTPAKKSIAEIMASQKPAPPIDPNLLTVPPSRFDSFLDELPRDIRRSIQPQSTYAELYKSAIYNAHAPTPSLLSRIQKADCSEQERTMLWCALLRAGLKNKSNGKTIETMYAEHQVDFFNNKRLMLYVAGWAACTGGHLWRRRGRIRGRDAFYYGAWLLPLIWFYQMHRETHEENDAELREMLRRLQKLSADHADKMPPLIANRLAWHVKQSKEVQNKPGGLAKQYRLLHNFSLELKIRTENQTT